MCKAIEERLNNQKIEIVINLIRTGVLSYSMIADCTGLTLEDVEKIAATLDHTA